MPTITFSYKDFQQLLGAKLPIEKFGEMLLLYAKAELGKHDNDEITVELDDTNLPCFWCPEGLARFFRGILGLSKGMPRLKVKSSSCKVVVDASVKQVRPFIAAFVAKGKEIDDYLLKQLIQMQEKFCEGYGRRRQKASIGLYAYSKIAFPVHYKAVEPGSAKFVPLDFSKSMDLNQILKEHPKGQQYAWILKGASNYPLLQDDKGEILSFPPIINSSSTGRLQVGDSEMLFEATGTDEESVNLAASIFAHNLSEREFEIFSATMSYAGKAEITPSMTAEKVGITPEIVEKITGLKLASAQLKQLLARAGYGFTAGNAIVPSYRADIMHPVDVAEDVAIAFGYDKIADEPLKSYTLGMPDSSVRRINGFRKAAVAMGFQEIFSHILTDKSSLIDRGMAVELENCMSETYSAVRDSILPQMLDVFAKNKHEEYPQRIFEEGVIALRAGAGGKISETHSLALASAHSKADFTEIKQRVAALLSAAGVDFSIQPAGHPAFMQGRSGRIFVGRAAVGVIGEVSPEVLSKWGVEMPVAAAEIDIGAMP